MIKTYDVPEPLMKRIENDFTYHPPKPDQVERYESIRSEAKEMAEFAVKIAPPSRELSLALTSLEAFVFYLNAAIARNE